MNNYSNDYDAVASRRLVVAYKRCLLEKNANKKGYNSQDQNVYKRFECKARESLVEAGERQ